MTAFSDALELRTAVIEAVGDASITDVWPRLVALAEARLNLELRTRHQITTAHLDFVDGAAAVPGDFLEIIAAAEGSVTVPSIPSGAEVTDYASIYTGAAG